MTGSSVRESARALNKQEIMEAVVEAMTAHRSIDAETHQDHHAFIMLMMEREARRVDRVKRFQMSFIGAIAVVMVGFLVWVGQVVIQGVGAHGVVQMK